MMTLTDKAIRPVSKNEGRAMIIVGAVIVITIVCINILQHFHPTASSLSHTQWANEENVDPSCLNRDDPNAAFCVVERAVSTMLASPEAAGYGMGPDTQIQGIYKAAQVIEEQNPYRWTANNRAAFNADMTINLTIADNKILALTVSDSQGPHVVKQTVLQYQ